MLKEAGKRWVGWLMVTLLVAAFSYGVGVWSAPVTSFGIDGSGNLDVNGVESNTLRVAALTGGRIPFIGLNGIISDISTLIYNSTTGALSTTKIIASTVDSTTSSTGTSYIENPVINGVPIETYISSIVDSKRLYPQTIGDGQASGLFSNMVVGENVTAGEALYLKTDGKLYKSDADSNTTLPVIVLALEAISADQVGYVLNSGFYKDAAWTWSTGGVLYASGAAGDLTQTKPTGVNIVQTLGYAFTPTTIYFNPSMLITTGASVEGGGDDTPPPTGVLTLTIDQTLVDETLTNFPVLIVLNVDSPVFDVLAYATRLKFNVTTSAGADCYVEIESWSDAPKGALLWVKVPSISATQNTVLYLNYDAGMANNVAYVGDVDSVPGETVWSNGYVGVWHLDETGVGTAGEYKDSTTANNGGRAGVDVHNTFTASQVPATGAGKMGNAADFDGVNDRLVIPDVSAYSIITTDQLSVGFWIEIADIDQSPYDWWAVLGKGDYTISVPNARHEWKFNFYNDALPDYPTGRHQRRSVYTLDKDSGLGSGNYAQPGYNYAGEIPEYVNGDWVYVVGQWGAPEADHVYMYNGPGISGHAGVNYILGEGASGNTIDLQDGASPVFVGSYDPEHQGAPTYHDGKIDELRISNVARSVAWMRADYYNQLNSLVTISAP